LSQENCLRKGGRSYRFRQVGKRSPSGWDPRGAIPSSVIIMLRSSQTRRAPSSPLPAPCRLGLPQLHPLAIARGSAPAGSGGGKSFSGCWRCFMSLAAPAGAGSGLIPTCHIGWKGFSCFGGREGWPGARTPALGGSFPASPSPCTLQPQGGRRAPQGCGSCRYSYVKDMQKAFQRF